MDSLEREVSSTHQEVRDSATRAEQMRRGWRLWFGIAVGVIAVAALVGLQLYSAVTTKLHDAQVRVAAAEQQARTVSEAPSTLLI